MHDARIFEPVSFGFARLDGTLRVHGANAEMAALLGTSPDQLKDRLLVEVLPEVEGRLLTKPYDFELVTRPDARVLAFDFLQSNDLGVDEWSIFGRDVTQSIVSTSRSDEGTSLARLRMVLNVLPDGIFIADTDGVTLYANDEFLHLSGTRRDQVVGKTVYDLMQEGVVSNSATAAVIATGESQSTINVYRGGRSCLVSGTPIFIDGKLDRVVCVIRDLTELNQLRNKLAEASSLSLGYERRLREIEVQNSHEAVIDSRSKAMREVFDKATKIASVGATVLLRGETGVGKDYVAQFIHDASERSKTGALVKINCGAIPETLLESELFGYERGAFTGADRQGKAGLFEIAKNGTLFLDEIGEMPRALQVKLLNVLQDKKFYRLGGTRMLELEARIVAATNADLEKMIEEGSFRRDLYHRLDVVSIVIPPLRDRRDDILPLILRFLQESNRQYGRNCWFSQRSVERLIAHDWPGNIRELRNLVERLVIMSDGSCIEVERMAGVAERGSGVTLPPLHDGDGDGLTLRERVEQFEAACIEAATRRTQTLREAADSLGIDLSTLVRKRQKMRRMDRLPLRIP